MDFLLVLPDDSFENPSFEISIGRNYDVILHRKY